MVACVYSPSTLTVYAETGESLETHRGLVRKMRTQGWHLQKHHGTCMTSTRKVWEQNWGTAGHEEGKVKRRIKLVDSNDGGSTAGGSVGKGMPAHNKDLSLIRGTDG